MSFNTGSVEYFPGDNDEASLSQLTASAGGDINNFTSRDRPFVCHVCSKRFTQKAHLIIHKRIHTGEKPYSCHICHKRFAQSSHLTVHKRVHTGEKPFFCNFCGMGFCRRPRLEAHILQHVVKEGKTLPSNLKGNMLNKLSMVGLDNMGTKVARSNQESLDAASQLIELKMKAEAASDVKNEPLDLDDNDLAKNMIEVVAAADKCSEADSGRKRRKPEFVRRVGSHEGDMITPVERMREDSSFCNDKNSNNKSLLGLSSDDLEKIASSLSELTEVEKHNLILGSSKNNVSLSVNNNLLSSNSRTLHSPMLHNSALSMSGLVRTNSRISLVDFTAEDILQHLMTRDDVKSCSFCCIIFHDPAMYYLHRSMHDKMDVRCCNLCGKLLLDKYDFTAHFLSQHK